MFSSLNNIYGTQKPRQAESTDARLGIKRQNQEQGRRKQKDQDSDEEFIFSADNASVSVDALRAFLETFLKHGPTADANEPDADAAQTTPAAEKAPEQPATNNGNMARAAGAYATAAQTTTPTSSFSIRETKQAAEDLGLSADEMRTIRELLGELKILMDRGITDLEINRGETFLQSLVDAVALAKLQR